MTALPPTHRVTLEDFCDVCVMPMFVPGKQEVLSECSQSWWE